MASKSETNMGSITIKIISMDPKDTNNIKTVSTKIDMAPVKPNKMYFETLIDGLHKVEGDTKMPHRQKTRMLNLINSFLDTINIHNSLENICLIIEKNVIILISKINKKLLHTLYIIYDDYHITQSRITLSDCTNYGYHYAFYMDSETKLDATKADRRCLDERDSGLQRMLEKINVEKCVGYKAHLKSPQQLFNFTEYKKIITHPLYDNEYICNLIISDDFENSKKIIADYFGINITVEKKKYYFKSSELKDVFKTNIKQQLSDFVCTINTKTLLLKIFNMYDNSVIQKEKDDEYNISNILDYIFGFIL